MKAFLIILTTTLTYAGASEPLELRKAGGDHYRIMDDRKKLAELMPDKWQGNLNIFSTENNKQCGVNWPHFLMYSQGKWLTDRVESEGLNLLEFNQGSTSGDVISYSGKWAFRDYFTSSESHFVWYDATNALQVHRVKARLEILKDLSDISSAWVEFMTPVRSYTMVAAKLRGGRIVSTNLSLIEPKDNRHYLDRSELADDGWITIYGARKGQGACAALVPLNHSAGPLRPRVYDWNVDNIEIHVLDAEKSNFLKRGTTFSLEYLLIVGPDQDDWKWVEPAIENARAFMRDNAASFQ